MINLDLIPIPGNIIHVDDTYSVMVIQAGDTYECYGMKHYHPGETPFMFMFGELCENTTFLEAIDMAIANVPLYDSMFEGEK